MKEIAIELLLLAALLALAGVVGYAYRGDMDNQVISAANAANATCLAGAGAKDQVLATVKDQVAALRKQHDDALAAAAPALQQREADVTALADTARQRATAIAQSPHDDKDCQALGDLPVCAAVARQLWPALAPARASGDPAGHH